MDKGFGLSRWNPNVVGQPALLLPRTLLAKGKYQPHSKSPERSVDFFPRLWRNRGGYYLKRSSLNIDLFRQISTFHNSCYNSSWMKVSSQTVLHSSGLFPSLCPCLGSSLCLHSHPVLHQLFPQPYDPVSPLMWGKCLAQSRAFSERSVNTCYYYYSLTPWPCSI